MAEEFRLDIRDGVCHGPTRIRTLEEIGLTAGGETDALNRLVNGTPNGLTEILQTTLNVGRDRQRVWTTLIQHQLRPLLIPAMPLQDAIELAEFLVELTIKFSLDSDQSTNRSEGQRGRGHQQARGIPLDQTKILLRPSTQPTRGVFRGWNRSSNLPTNNCEQGEKMANTRIAQNLPANDCTVITS